MKRYAVQLKPSADRALRKLPVDVQRRIVRALDGLATGPRPDGVVKLTGDEILWRIRVGDCRVVYAIHGKRLTLLVLRVAHRRDVNRGLSQWRRPSSGPAAAIADADDAAG